MPFKNRSEAGQKPAGALFNYRDQDSVILALPRGSVPVAAEVAAALDAPLWRTAIVIDDGIATGATMRAPLRATRVRNPKKPVFAAPVAPSESIVAMRAEADEVICLEDHEFFGAIGLYLRRL